MTQVNSRQASMSLKSATWLTLLPCVRPPSALASGIRSELIIRVLMIVAIGGYVNSTDGYLVDTSASATGPLLLLAHGAGAPADSPFMADLAAALVEQGVTVIRFEFPYMARRREDGRKRPPDRQDKLLADFREHLEQLRKGPGRGRRIFIGGKSMGGRMASVLASAAEFSGGFEGVVCFGYPFHPPGKPDRWRVGHFPELQCPVCILQGTRDPFGKPEEVAAALPAPNPVTIHWLEGGDHDLLPPKRQAASQADLIREAARLAAEFMAGV